MIISLDQPWTALANQIGTLAPERSAALARACQAPNRTALVTDGKGGWLLAVGRPTTGYMKVVDLEGDGGALTAALAAALRQKGFSFLKGSARGDVWARPPGAQDGPEATKVQALSPAAERLQTFAGRAYFAQTTAFTCGPSSLQMALARVGHDSLNRRTELSLWREATYLVGKEGPGGCDPFGLALAAQRGGLQPRLIMNSEAPLFLQRAPSDELRELMAFVQGDFRDRAKAELDIVWRDYRPEDLAGIVDQGGGVVLLIDEFPMHGWHVPHWILLHAHAEGVFLAQDPWTERSYGETWLDSSDLPLSAEQLMTLGAWGDEGYRAAILLPQLR